MLESNVIHSTTDYDIFKPLPLNRGNGKINERHLDRLRASVMEQNLLPVRPMIVTTDMMIIDGHHRLEVAKRLQLPIYYLVSDEVNYKSAMRLTQATTDWSTWAYVDVRAANGEPEFVKLKNFLDKNRITITWFFRLSSFHWNNSTTTKGHGRVPQLKNGRYKFDESLYDIEPIIEQIHDFISILVESGISKLKTDKGDFWYGAFRVFSNRNFNWERFQRKLKNRIYEMKVFSSWRGVAECILKIHNHDSTGKFTPIDRTDILPID